VELEEATLTALGAINRLRIICAGVWHNMILAIFSFLLLLSLPQWTLLGYQNLSSPESRGGVVVLETMEASSLPF
jgi:membrane-associated protease RseP (regulator of RpoE activity)